MTARAREINLIPYLLLAATLTGRAEPSGGTAVPAGMEYVEVCKTPGDCKKFSRLVMGTDHLIQGDWTGPGQPQLSDEDAFRVLDEAAKHGINFFDTSPIYVGNVENRLGQWLKSRAGQVKENGWNPDRKLYVLSKGGFPFDLFYSKLLEKGTHSPELLAELSKRGILKSTELTPTGNLSLQDVPPGTYASRLFGSREQITARVAEELGHSTANLSEDIAVYLMHRDDGDAVAFEAIRRPQTDVKAILLALSAEELSSKFWSLGWSNWETERVNQSVKVAEHDKTVLKPAFNSPYFSLFEMSHRSIHALGVQVTHQEMMDPNFQKGIKLMPYSPLGGFSILDKPEPQWENGKAAAKKKFEEGDPYWQNVFHSIFTKENEERWHRVVAFTKAFNEKQRSAYTVDQMINAYALAHPRTDLLAIGAITIEQVRRSVQSLELSKKLTPADLDYLYSGR